MSSTEQLRVVIADDIPLDRHLLRFFLEEDGIQVVAEAARGAEAARLVAEYLPDAVILHESLTVAEGAGSIPLIRRTSPSTKIVTLSSHPEDAPHALSSRGADVRLEERVGLKDLSFVLKTLCWSPHIAIEAEEQAGGEEPEPSEQVAAGQPVSLDEYRSKSAQPSGRRLARLQTVAAACILVFAFMLSRSAILNPSSVVHPSAMAGESADAQLQTAIQRLQDLLDSMRAGATDVIPANAQALVDARAAAVAAGADVSQLDALIAASVPDLLPQLPSATAQAVQEILGSLLKTTPPPTPEPTRSPPEPSAKPSPSPTETPSPSPSPTETPTPTPSRPTRLRLPVSNGHSYALALPDRHAYAFPVSNGHSYALALPDRHAYAFPVSNGHSYAHPPRPTRLRLPRLQRTLLRPHPPRPTRLRLPRLQRTLLRPTLPDRHAYAFPVSNGHSYAHTSPTDTPTPSPSPTDTPTPTPSPTESPTPEPMPPISTGSGTRPPAAPSPRPDPTAPVAGELSSRWRSAPIRDGPTAPRRALRVSLTHLPGHPRVLP